jgi:hypothetical protein
MDTPLFTAGNHGSGLGLRTDVAALPSAFEAGTDEWVRLGSIAG